MEARRIYEGSQPVSSERLESATILDESKQYLPMFGEVTLITAVEDGVETRWMEIPPDIVLNKGYFTELPPLTEEDAQERERRAEEFKQQQLAMPPHKYAEGEDPDVWNPNAQALLESRIGDTLSATNVCNDPEHEDHEHHVVVRSVTKHDPGGSFSLTVDVIDGPLCGTTVTTVEVWPLWLNDLRPGSTPYLGQGECFDMDILA